MRKKLTALVLSALPLAAVADVSLYGEIKAGVEGRNFQLQLTEQPQTANTQQGGKVKVTKAKSRSGRKSVISARLSALRGARIWAKV
ncbi:porin [Neisseria meningitidis]|nr:porin [Neisseria meningitidis]